MMFEIVGSERRSSPRQTPSSARVSSRRLVELFWAQPGGSKRGYGFGFEARFGFAAGFFGFAAGFAAGFFTSLFFGV
jgi:hypothetical protein